jgi:cytochrome o ubiquinol oxidase operon protein cyoD
MQDNLSLKKIKKGWHGTLRSYVIGLVVSLLFTVIAFSLVAFRVIDGDALKFSVIGLAILQAAAQLLFFLHLGRESQPRWETLVFFFMVMVVLIIVIGTLWIMYDLNNRVMSGMAHTM